MQSSELISALCLSEETLFNLVLFNLFNLHYIMASFLFNCRHLNLFYSVCAYKHRLTLRDVGALVCIWEGVRKHNSEFIIISKLIISKIRASLKWAPCIILTCSFLHQIKGMSLE